MFQLIIIAHPSIKDYLVWGFRIPINVKARLFLFIYVSSGLSLLKEGRSALLIQKANMTKAIRAIIPPKIKGAPGDIYFHRKPAIRDERKVMRPIRVW